MARPAKNYCEYFSHDRDMRNHRKIKAIRTKYKITGYAIWCMILEYLTGADGNVFEYSDVELELMAGDFGVSVTEIREVIDYCIKLELLFLKDGFINSESLDERLKSVYEKRKVAKSKSKQQLRDNGKFAPNNTESSGVSVTEMPQSKVNKSKVEESKEKGFPKFPKPEDMNGLPEVKITSAIEQIYYTKKIQIPKETVLGMWEGFKKQTLTGKKFYENEEEIHNHYINWLKKQDFEKLNMPIRLNNPIEDDARRILKQVNQK